MIPEAIFSAGLGDLFVIRSAGNTVDDGVLDSIDYAADHVGCRLVVVMGHTHCGAVAEAMAHPDEGHPMGIVRAIIGCIGDEKDPEKASRINVMNTLEEIGRDACLHSRPKVMGAMYDIDTGIVDFFDYHE